MPATRYVDQVTHHLRSGAAKGVEVERVVRYAPGRRKVWRRKDTGEIVENEKVERRIRTVRR